ncbi:hypothetical protein GCM10019017_74090 [Streptomyces showdoensis]
MPPPCWDRTAVPPTVTLAIGDGSSNCKVPTGYLAHRAGLRRRLSRITAAAPATTATSTAPIPNA